MLVLDARGLRALLDALFTEDHFSPARHTVDCHQLSKHADFLSLHFCGDTPARRPARIGFSRQRVADRIGVEPSAFRDLRLGEADGFGSLHQFGGVQHLHPCNIYNIADIDLIRVSVSTAMLLVPTPIPTTHSDALQKAGRTMNSGSATRADLKQAVRSVQRRWLDWVVLKTELSLSVLAVQAGIRDVTLTRFANDPEYDGALSTMSIAQIKDFTGLPGPEEWLAAGAEGFGEEVASFQCEPESLTAVVISALLRGRPGAYPKKIVTRLLEDAGYREGDIVIIDVNVPPEVGKVVCANIYGRGGAETVLRVYRKVSGIDILMPAGNENGEPLLVDNDRVKIMGAVTESFRPRSP